MRYFYLLTMVSGISLHGADSLQIGTLQLTPNATKIEIEFNAALSDGTAEHEPEGFCTIEIGKKSIETVFLPSSNIKRLKTALDEPLKPGVKVSVTCAKIVYFANNARKEALNLDKITKVVPTPGEREEEILGRIKKTLANKKQDEKDIFASGFVTTGSGTNSGGADISLNPDLKIPGLKPFLQIKKTTTEGGDAKNFESGIKFQKVFIDRSGFNAIRNLGNASNDEIARKFRDATSKSFFSGSTVDLAAKMEGAAGKFDVTNFVGDGGFQLRTKVMPLAGKKGWLRGFILPVGMEGGQSHWAQDQATATGSKDKFKPDWIARYKAGLGFNLHFADDNGLLKRIELNGNGVMRNLFYGEAMYNAKSKMVDRTGKGVRAYGQIDLKVYLGESDKGRYGVKLSYNRGSLPPVFAKVKSFQFGFLWESKDDKPAAK